MQPHPVGERDSALGRLRVAGIDKHAPGHAGARRRQADFSFRGRSVDRDSHAVGASPCGAAKTATRIAPAGSFQRAVRHRPVGVAPFHVGRGRSSRTARRSGRRRATARDVLRRACDEPRGEGDERSVGVAPVDCARSRCPGRRRCCCRPGCSRAPTPIESIGVPREATSSGQQIALVARARRLNRRIVARPLDAVVPGIIVVRTVAIVLAVGLVVLVVVGDEIGEREAVVGDDEIDAF